MKKKNERRITMLLAIMMLVMNLIVSPVWAEPGVVAINELNFPDKNFRKYVSKFNTNGDDALSQDELNAVTEIDVMDKGITNLKGIERFTSLKKLDCGENRLTALDISKNINLETLYCNRNQLTTLDLSKNTNLEILNCGENRLTALDLTKNTKLRYLNCYANPLGALDLSKNTELTDINCAVNHLTTLDLSHNTKLTDIDCNQNQLTTLDLSHNTKLEDLRCQGNKLEALDLTNNTKLRSLYCFINQLTKLDLSKNTELTLIECQENQLTTLDLSKNTELTYLECQQNHLTNLDLSHNSRVDMFSEFSGFGQVYNIKVSDSTLKFDLRSLPGKFNPSNASEWDGGDVEGNNLILDDDKPTTVIYEYNVKTGLPTLKVKLNVAYENVVTVSFDNDGGEGTMNSEVLSQGSNYKLPACTFTPPTGKEFKAWEVGGVEKPVGDSITVNADTKVKAIWKEKAVTPVTYNLTASIDGGHGSVSPTTKTVDKDETVTLTFTPDAGYEIEEVKVNNVVTPVSGNTLTLTMDGNKTVVVKYKKTPPEMVTITFNANGHGTAPEPITVNKGTVATAPTDPTDTENNFGGWYTEAACTTKFDFTQAVNDNITLYAKWTEKTYTLNASVDGGHGSVSPTNETKNAGDTVTLTFAPDTGYEIEEVKVNDVVTPVSGNTLTLTMDGDKTVVVKYKKTPTPPPTPTVDSIAVNSTEHKTEYKVGETLDVTNLTILVTMSDTTTKTVPVTSDMVDDFDTSTAGTKTLTITYEGKKTTYNINVTPVTCTLRAGVIGGHGTVSPELATVEKGKSVKVTFTSEDGYKVDTITINDEPTGVTGVSFSWNITMDEDKIVEVKFKPLDTPPTPTQCTFTASVDGGHGSVIPESATVDRDKFLEVTFAPDAGYEIDTVTLDGEDVKSQVASNKLLVGMYKNRTLTVKFKPTGTTPPPATQYTLTASVNGGHGTVTPPTKTVDKDETVTLTFAPETGYEIDEVKVNGTVVGVMSNVLDIIMNENKTVVVKFKATGTPPIGTPVTITFDKNGGTGTMADVTKTKGESFTLPACGFTAPAGKEFKAWKVDGTEKNVGDNIVLNGDKNIKAVWKDIGSVPPTPPVPPTPYTPYPWIVYPGWYYNFETPKPREEKPVTKMEMDWKIELMVGVSTIDREINGVQSKIKMDVAPYIRDGRTMLPIRYVAEALGFDVEWNRSTRTVVLKDNNTRVEIPVDTNKIIVNGTVYTSDVKPEIKNNRTMLPIANIARALGLKDGKDIIWNSKSKMVTIYRSVVIK